MTCNRGWSRGLSAPSLALLLTAVACLATAPEGSAEPKGSDGRRVRVLRTPDGGIQPQAVVGPGGTLHLLYFKGEPAGGDLFYVRRDAGQKEFSAPLRVNSEPGSAVALGTIRGGQLTVGKGGRVHVAWNGSRKASLRGPLDSLPMLYSRLNDAGNAFEPQRNLMRVSTVLDGGGTVAADDQGRVYVAWQALPVGSERGEGNRKPFVARSEDEGKTFSQEFSLWDRPTGACGCCGMRAFVDGKGVLYILYRSATEVVQRDMYLLASRDAGKHFEQLLLDPCKANLCPMSSEACAVSGGKAFAAWETRGQVRFARLEGGALLDKSPTAVPGPASGRNHPSLAVSARGELLVAWAEGTGWQRGGALAWQLFDSSGTATEVRGRVENGVPVWSLPSAVALPDGTFLLFH